MLGVETRIERPLARGDRARVEAFLARFGLRFEGSPGTTVLAEDPEGRLVGTVSLEGDVIKMAAVDPDLQEGGLLAALVSRIAEVARSEGRTRLFVYTKPEAAEKFRYLGFSELARTEETVLMETGAPGAAAFREELEARWRAEGCPERNGAVVINANPFTRGHRYLIERAAEVSPRVWVVVVEADLSSFPLADRLEMIRRGTEDLPGVRLLGSGPYAVSPATFPAYFLKETSAAALAPIQGRLDAALFAALFAPPLRILRRFVGTEPYCPVTAAYNEALEAVLPGRGVQVIRIPRLEWASGEAVSASRVRAAIRETDWALLERLLPPTSLAYLRDPARAPLLERIRSGAGRH